MFSFCRSFFHLHESARHSSFTKFAFDAAFDGQHADCDYIDGSSSKSFVCTAEFQSMPLSKNSTQIYDAGHDCFRAR